VHWGGVFFKKLKHVLKLVSVAQPPQPEITLEERVMTLFLIYGRMTPMEEFGMVAIRVFSLGVHKQPTKINK